MADLNDVTHDGTCPRCGRRLRQVRDLDWLAAASHRITCECGVKVDVTVGYVYRVEVAGERRSNGG